MLTLLYAALNASHKQRCVYHKLISLSISLLHNCHNATHLSRARDVIGYNFLMNNANKAQFVQNSCESFSSCASFVVSCYFISL